MGRLILEKGITGRDSHIALTPLDFTLVNNLTSQIVALKKRQSRARCYAFAGRISFEVADILNARISAKLEKVREQVIQVFTGDRHEQPTA